MIYAFTTQDDGYGLAGLNLGLLILRLAVGLTIATSGFTHSWGRERVERTASWLEGKGLEPGRLQARLIGSVELLSGVGLVLGLLTPLAAAGVVGACGVHFAISGKPRSLIASVGHTGHGYMVSIAVVALALGATGPGQWSLDRILDNELFGLRGFVITVLVGLGSIAVTLVGFWQPARARHTKSGRLNNH